MAENGLNDNALSYIENTASSSINSTLKKLTDSISKLSEDANNLVPATSALKGLFGTGVTMFKDFQSGNYLGMIIDGFNGLRSTMEELTSSIKEYNNKWTDMSNALNYFNMQSSIYARYAEGGANWNSILQSAYQQNGQSYITGLYGAGTYYNNVSKLIGAGYQGIDTIEAEAQLMSVADRLVTSFDNTFSVVKAINRIQQDDLTRNTVYRINVEELLNKTLTDITQSTEYLSQMTSVTNKLMGTESLMTSSNSAAFDLIVQSYLGTLYNNGVSDSTISSIATALNALGTGDVTGISSGSGTLLAKAAASAGLSYGNLLVNGFESTDDVTLLMQAIINEMSGAWGEGSNNVVSNQLAKIYGVSNVSDLKAAYNTVGDLAAIAAELSGSNIGASTYSNLIDQAADRTSAVTRGETTLSNLKLNSSINTLTDDELLSLYLTGRMYQEFGFESTGQSYINIATSRGISSTLNALSGDTGDIISNTDLSQISAFNSDTTQLFNLVLDAVENNANTNAQLSELVAGIQSTVDKIGATLSKTWSGILETITSWW